MDGRGQTDDRNSESSRTKRGLKHLRQKMSVSSVWINLSSLSYKSSINIRFDQVDKGGGLQTCLSVRMRMMRYGFDVW